ncbi:MAG: hypothetical protein MSS53_01260 [Oscillibacter sp.]|nr:hypothetical protein [Oscillibacter sp.]
MAEYIERAVVIDLITRRYENPEICTQEINSIPAANVAPVTRCKDCKHSALPSELTRRYGKPGTLTCHNRYAPCNRRNVSGDDFCSYGERKESSNADDHD